jgi:uncharacterized protein YndB with AHSA1/START domain
MQQDQADAVMLTKPSEREVVITRHFAAPRALVFKVWTEPAHVVRWWGPEGFRATRCDIDLRPGGRYLIDMTGPDGKSYPTEGTYLEVTPPQRLVSDQHFACLGKPEASLRVTVTFEEEGSGTVVKIHTLCESAEIRDALVEVGIEKGWGETFLRLADYLKHEG